MPSLLDYLLGQGTPLATDASGQVTGTAAPPTGGLLGGFRDYAANNSDRLMSMGMGFLSGANQQEGFANAMGGMQKGALLDRQRTALQQAQMDKLAKQKAAQAAAKSLGIDPNVAEAAPGVIGDVAARKYDPEAGLKSQMLKLQLQKLSRDPSFDENAKLQWYQGLPEDQKPAAAAMLGITGSSSITSQIGERTRAATQLGLKPGDPAYQSYILTGKMPREDAQPQTATDKKFIMEADDGVLSAQAAIENLQKAKELSKGAYEGFGAGKRGYITSQFGSEAGTKTQELDNVVQTNALSSLKAIFGGNPTEGERAILLEIQGSSSKSDAVRQGIYDRAIKMAERRLEMNKQRANELRGGTFYKSGGGVTSSSGTAKADPLSAADAIVGIK